MLYYILQSVCASYQIVNDLLHRATSAVNYTSHMPREQTSKDFRLAPFQTKDNDSITSKIMTHSMNWTELAWLNDISTFTSRLSVCVALEADIVCRPPCNFVTAFPRYMICWPFDINLLRLTVQVSHYLILCGVQNYHQVWRLSFHQLWHIVCLGLLSFGNLDTWHFDFKTGPQVRHVILHFSFGTF